MCQFLCFSFSEGAFLAIDETNFYQDVCWYSSIRNLKIGSNKFCGLCTLKSHLINLFPVELLFCCQSDIFLPLLLTSRVGWFTFSWYKFLIYYSAWFLLFRNFVKKRSCLVEILVLWGIYLWRSLIEEMIPRKVKGRTVRSCIVWKEVSKRNFPESYIKCSTFVIPLRKQSL